MSIVSHRYAQIGREKSRGVFVGVTGRAEIMKRRDRFVRRTMAAFGLWLPKTVTARVPCFLVYSAGAYADAEFELCDTAGVEMASGARIRPCAP